MSFQLKEPIEKLEAWVEWGGLSDNQAMQSALLRLRGFKTYLLKFNQSEYVVDEANKAVTALADLMHGMQGQVAEHKWELFSQNVLGLVRFIQNELAPERSEPMPAEELDMPSWPADVSMDYADLSDAFEVARSDKVLNLSSVSAAALPGIVSEGRVDALKDFFMRSSNSLVEIPMCSSVARKRADSRSSQDSKEDAAKVAGLFNASSEQSLADEHIYMPLTPPRYRKQSPVSSSSSAPPLPPMRNSDSPSSPLRSMSATPGVFSKDSKHNDSAIGLGAGLFGSRSSSGAAMCSAQHEAESDVSGLTQV
jgi:hypothetical protein